jgi:hypothetical protein
MISPGARVPLVRNVITKNDRPSAQHRSKAISQLLRVTLVDP